MSLPHLSVNAIDALSNVNSMEALNLGLQTIAKDLGFDESLYGSKYHLSFSNTHVQSLGLDNGLFALLAKQHTFTLGDAYRKCLETGLNQWSQVLPVYDFAKQSSLDYVVCCAFIHHNEHHSLLVFIASAQVYKAQALDKKTAHLLHIADVAAQQMSVLRQKLHPLLDVTVASNPNPLTVRELEILRYTADGKTAEDVAGLLKITPRTVNFHMAQLMSVLRVPNKTSAVAKAVLKGWVFMSDSGWDNRSFDQPPLA